MVTDSGQRGEVSGAFHALVFQNIPDYLDQIHYGLGRSRVKDVQGVSASGQLGRCRVMCVRVRDCMKKKSFSAPAVTTENNYAFSVRSLEKIPGILFSQTYPPRKDFFVP